MIDNLDEINRILVAVEALSTKKGALESTVVKFCKEFVFRDAFPNHRETINFCVDAGVVKRNGNRVVLTKSGKDLLTLNPAKNYELNEKQKDYFVRNCLLVGILAPRTREIVAQFEPLYATGTYQWSPIDNPPLKGDPTFIALMNQSGLFATSGMKLTIDGRYVPFVRDLFRPPGFLTPDELASRLKSASEIGGIAEEIVLEYERNRLKKNGFIVEAECVQRISELNVAAGYDIASFNGQKKDLVHDRFIEVKGSTGLGFEFYWSSSEIERSKVLKERYWVYLVRGINKEEKKSNIEPLLIRNPYKRVFQSSEFVVEPEQFWVSKRKDNQNVTP